MRWKIILTAGLSIAVLAAFLSLGFWQLRRLEWKQGVLAEIEARIATDPVALPATPDPRTDRFLPVHAAGTLRDGVRVLASTRDLGPGYRILQVLEMDGARRILVDLGFQPIEQHAELVPDRQVTITGNLHWPDEVDRWTPAPEPENGLWFARDVPAISGHLGTDPVLVVARRVTPPAAQTITPLPVSSEGIPNDHLEYAVTWFLMAATWVVMTGFALWHMRRRGG